MVLLSFCVVSFGIVCCWTKCLAVELKDERGWLLYYLGTWRPPCPHSQCLTNTIRLGIFSRTGCQKRLNVNQQHKKNWKNKRENNKRRRMECVCPEFERDWTRCKCMGLSISWNQPSKIHRRSRNYSIMRNDIQRIFNEPYTAYSRPIELTNRSPSHHNLRISNRRT